MKHEKIPFEFRVFEVSGKFVGSSFNTEVQRKAKLEFANNWVET